MRFTKAPYFLTVISIPLLLLAGACTKLCNSGYEGSRCNVLTTTKFTGQWNVVDTPGNLIYIDTISQGSVLGDITLSIAFAGHHFNHVINASVAADVVTIPYQQPDSATNFVQGTGTISKDDKNITFTYQLISGTDSTKVISNYAGTWVKQN
jgi:hypothetical protein